MSLSRTSTVPTARSRSGFTLIEILCVLALLGIIGGAIAVNVRSLLPGLRDDSLETKFVTALRDTRRAALDSGKTQRLEFNEDEQKFVRRALSDPPPEETPKPFGKQKPANTIRFLRQTATANQYLVGGELRSLEPATLVLFYPDGTCTPFTAEIVEGNARREMRIDPWTTAEIDAGSDKKP